MSLRKRGRQSWSITVDLGRDAGGQRIRHFATFRGGKRAAEAYERELRAQAEKGISISAQRLTLGDFLTRWLEARMPSLRPNSVAAYQRHIALITAHLGHVQLARLSPLACQEFVAALQQSRLAPITIAQVFGTLRSSLKQAVRWQLVGINVAEAVDLPTARAKETKPLEVAQVEHIMAACSDPEFARLIAVTFGVGLRAGEVAGLAWSAIDDGLLSVRQQVVRAGAGKVAIGAPKTHASTRTVRLAPSTITVLAEQRRAQLEQRIRMGAAYHADLDLVFPLPDGQPYPPERISARYKAVAKRAGIDTTIHALRHAHAQALLASGVSTKIAAVRLGHSSPRVTSGIYQHTSDVLDEAAALAIEAVLTRPRIEAR